MNREPTAPFKMILVAAPIGTIALMVVISFGLQAIDSSKQISGSTWRNAAAASLLTSVTSLGLYGWAQAQAKQKAEANRLTDRKYREIVQDVVGDVLSDSEHLLYEGRQRYLSDRSSLGDPLDLADSQLNASAPSVSSVLENIQNHANYSSSPPAPEPQREPAALPPAVRDSFVPTPAAFASPFDDAWGLPSEPVAAKAAEQSVESVDGDSGDDNANSFLDRHLFGTDYSQRHT